MVVKVSPPDFRLDCAVLPMVVVHCEATQVGRFHHDLVVGAGVAVAATRTGGGLGLLFLPARHGYRPGAAAGDGYGSVTRHGSCVGNGSGSGDGISGVMERLRPVLCRGRIRAQRVYVVSKECSGCM